MRNARLSWALLILLGGGVAAAVPALEPSGRILRVAQVHPGATDDGNGLPDASLRTIQAAVSRVAPGDEVIVHPGIYRESVSWTHMALTQALSEPTRRMTLRAADPADRPVISGADSIPGPWRPERVALRNPSDRFLHAYAREWAFAGPTARDVVSDLGCSDVSEGECVLSPQSPLRGRGIRIPLELNGVCPLSSGLGREPEAWAPTLLPDSSDGLRAGFAVDVYLFADREPGDTPRSVAGLCLRPDAEPVRAPSGADLEIRDWFGNPLLEGAMRDHRPMCVTGRMTSEELETRLKTHFGN